MNNVSDISDIIGKFKKVSEIKVYAEQLFIKLKIATETIQKQQEEIAHLKKLLDGAVTTPSIAAPSDISNEMLICEMEIARLQKTAADRPLSLEETKKLSILINDLISIKKAKKDKLDEDEDHTVEYNETDLLTIIKNEPTK